MTRLAQRIVGSKAFHWLVVAVIALAGVTAGLETSQAVMNHYGPVLSAIDRFILGVFLLEALLKMAAHGRKPWLYFRDGWNVFDFAVLTLCLLPAGGPFAAVLRLARALRLLRLVSALPKLQLLVGALLKSLSAMGYVSLLLALLFYIYAIVGTHLFGKADPLHFGSIGASLLTLFRIVTLDNWGEIYFAQAAHAPAAKVAFYFATFIVFGTMIILNLFIGIILNSMSETHREIAERDLGQEHPSETKASLAEELADVERQLARLQSRIVSLRERSAGTRGPEQRRRKGFERQTEFMGLPPRSEPCLLQHSTPPPS